MPVRPVGGLFQVALDDEWAVSELVDTARRLDPADAGKPGTDAFRIATDIGDHLMYLGVTHPEWFAPFRDEAIIDLPNALPMDVATACVLLPGASAEATKAVADRLERDPVDWAALTLLAAIGDVDAMARLADIVRAHGSTVWTDSMGVEVGETGPAVRRFATTRHSVRPLPGDPPGSIAIGRPIVDVALDTETVRWHYLTFATDELPGFPDWPCAQLHIVAPRTYWFTLHSEITADGRLVNCVVDDGGEPFDTGLVQAEDDPPPACAAEIRPYDEHLVYCNSNVSLTPGVMGTVGGPPVGIYPNPRCPGCGVLMFHGATVVSHIRCYGEGFRSVFLCEHCQRTATTGTSWN